MAVKLRNVIGFRWLMKISNQDLYKLTKQEPWSKTIKRRRLNWFGHLMRLHQDTPARQSLNETLQPEPSKWGRPKHPWIKQIQDDLKINNKNTHPKEKITLFTNLTKDRYVWRAIVKGLMEDTLWRVPEEERAVNYANKQHRYTF